MKFEYVFEPIVPEKQFVRQPWVYWDNYFSEPELDIIQNLAKLSKKPASVGGDNIDTKLDLSTRRTLVSWISYTEEYKWLYQKLSELIIHLNHNFFGFSLSGFYEPMQLANYISADKGAYDWHIDESSAIIRKLSIIIQLSYPWEYEGGNLEIKTNSDVATVIEKKRGLIIAFPSWTLHRVTPVVSGSRQSLVQWVTGPNFI